MKNKARANLLSGVNALPPQVAAMVQTLQHEIEMLKQQLAEKDELLSRAFDESLSSLSLSQTTLADDPLSYQLWEREMQLQDLRRMSATNNQQQQISSPALTTPTKSTVTAPADSALQPVIFTEAQANRAVAQLVNLNQDPLFSECIVFYIPEGTHVIGSDANADMELTGTDIAGMHCCLDSHHGVVTVRAINDAPTFVNGERVSSVPQLLNQSGTLVMGGNSEVWTLCNVSLSGCRPCGLWPASGLPFRQFSDSRPTRNRK